MVRVIGANGAQSFEPAPRPTMKFSDRFEISMDFSTSASAEVDREAQLLMAVQLRKAGLI